MGSVEEVGLGHASDALRDEGLAEWQKGAGTSLDNAPIRTHLSPSRRRYHHAERWGIPANDQS
ncbi:MAG: hypothetical protein PVH17_05790 [Anaerolineae bacterium]